jgi:hypothetical protein
MPITNRQEAAQMVAAFQYEVEQYEVILKPFINKDRTPKKGFEKQAAEIALTLNGLRTSIKEIKKRWDL